MNKKLLKHNKFVNSVCELVGDEYSVLGEYKTTKTKILMKHNICKYEWHVRPSNFLRGHRCPKCMQEKVNKKLFKTHNKFAEQLYNLIGNEYVILNKYTGYNKKILIKHEKCGYKYEVTPECILKGKRCPKCANRIPYTTEIFKNKIFELTNDRFTVMSEYISKFVEISIKHNICNKIFNVRPHNFLRTPKCPYCEKRGIKIQ